MKSSLRSLLVVATLSLCSPFAFAATETESGYVDMGQFAPSAKGQFVEINLSPAILKFAARMAGTQEPEVAQLLGSLKRVRVNVVGLDSSNREDVTAKIATLRQKLGAQGWTQLVTVRASEEGNKSENVDIHVKQSNEDTIEGLVITVIDEQGEAVFVNIVGNISADQIAEIANKLDIEPLKSVGAKIGKKAVKKQA